MTKLSHILLYLFLACLALKASDRLWTVAETQVWGWYLTRPSLTVVRMSSALSAAER